MRHLLFLLLSLLITDAHAIDGLESTYTPSRYNCFTERSIVGWSLEEINHGRTIDHKALIKSCANSAEIRSIYAYQEWPSICRPENNRTFYDLEVAGNSIILKQHLMFTTNAVSDDQRRFFVQTLKEALPIIKTWFFNHGIVYQPEIHNKFDDDKFGLIFDGVPTKKVSSYNVRPYGRAHANSTSSTAQLFLYRDEAQTKRAFASTNEFSALFLHENLHLLGLPDNYKDSQNCTNFSSGSSLLRNVHKQLDQYKDYIHTINIMSSITAFEVNGITSKDVYRLGLPTDYLYNLVGPLCPNLCENDSRSK